MRTFRNTTSLLLSKCTQQLLENPILRSSKPCDHLLVSLQHSLKDKPHRHPLFFNLFFTFQLWVQKIFFLYPAQGVYNLLICCQALDLLRPIKSLCVHQSSRLTASRAQIPPANDDACCGKHTEWTPVPHAAGATWVKSDKSAAQRWLSLACVFRQLAAKWLMPVRIWLN